MRRLVSAASVAVAVGTMMIPADTASASDAFRGSWTSIDPGDGSTQFLRVQGSGKQGNHSVFLRDTVATRACAGGPANVKGPGRVDGDTMTWTFTVTCPGGGKGPVVGRVGPGFFIYNAGSDTLIDDTGAVWHRQ